METLPSDTYFEELLAELSTGTRIVIFTPDSVDRSLLGHRCLLELDAFLGDQSLAFDSEERSLSSKRATGKIMSYHRDGVILDVGSGAIGVSECIDDRFEPGGFMEVRDFRLDLKRVVALEASDTADTWIPSESDPFYDPTRALQAFRSGEFETKHGTVVELDEDMKIIGERVEPRLFLWGQSVGELIYALGETGLTEAESDIADLLEHGDTFVRRAAVWVLSRHWNLSGYGEQLIQRIFDDRDAMVRKMAAIGVGILFRATRNLSATGTLVRLLHDKSVHWWVREAAYLALLGVWLPETYRARNQLQGWKPWKGHRDASNKDWDRDWASRRVDWSLVSSLGFSR